MGQSAKRKISNINTRKNSHLKVHVASFSPTKFVWAVFESISSALSSDIAHRATFQPYRNQQCYVK